MRFGKSLKLLDNKKFEIAVLPEMARMTHASIWRIIERIFPNILRVTSVTLR